MYETYIGDNDGREPRFSYDYLFHIELPVLKFFLPYLRFADLFNEHGLPTTFSVSPDSISAMIYPRGEKHCSDCVDLASFFVAKIDTVMGNSDGSIMEFRVSPSLDQTLQVMDDPMGQIRLFRVEKAGLTPNYEDISKRYYDCLGQQGPSSLN